MSMAAKKACAEAFPLPLNVALYLRVNSGDWPPRTTCLEETREEAAVLLESEVVEPILPR
jgi:hypothetical protein